MGVDKQKQRERSERWRKKHPERFRESVKGSVKKWREKNRDKIRAKNKLRGKADKLKYRYKITLEDYNKMLIAHNNSCAICGTHESEMRKGICIDHDHVTGKIRGLLCEPCNQGIGMFKDNIVSMASAINYLKSRQ